MLTIYAALQAHQLARDPQQARGESRDIMLVRLSFGQSETVPNDKLMLLQYFPPARTTQYLRCAAIVKLRARATTMALCGGSFAIGN